jgi:Domain of unknown function DUF11
MATRRLTKWICLLLVGGLFVDFSSLPIFGQGEEGNSHPTVVERSFTGAIQRFFGPKEPADAVKKPADRTSKPGIFHGNFAKQLRATSESSSQSDTSDENAMRLPNSEPQRSATSTKPSQIAQRAPREPFSNPQPQSSSKNTQNGSDSASTISRDVFAKDPPSLVGTGVNHRRITSSQSASRNLSSDDLPVDLKGIPSTHSSTAERLNASAPVSSSSSSRSNATKAETSEIPRVSRKTVPVVGSDSTRSVPATPPSTYAIPGNPYTPTASQGDTNRYTGGNAATTKPYSASSPATAVPPTPSMSSQSNVNAGANSQTSKVVNPNNAASSSLDARVGTRAEMGIPKVKLFVSGPPVLQVGKAIPYEILVRNEGNELLSGVIVSMVVPASVKTSLPVASAGEFDSEKDAQGIETHVWHVTDLGPAQSRTFRLSLEATKPEQFSMDVEWTVLPQTGKVQVAVHQPQLSLGLDGPARVLWGKPEIYRLRVRNPGNADVKDVQIKLAAESYGSNQSKIGDIAAGGEKVVEVELTFQQTGTIKLAGVASSAIQELEANAALDVAVDQIELATEWVGPSAQYQGSIAEHKLTVTNQSQVAAENVTCVASIPSGFKIVSLPPSAVMHGNEARWTVPRIEPNVPMVFEFALQAQQSGDTKLTSEIKCLGGGKVAAELLVKIDAISDLKMSVTDPIAPAPVGQDVVYDLTITNRGSKAATSVQLLAQFSNGIEPIRTEGGLSRVLPGQVVFEPIPVIEPGQAITLRVVAQASEPGMHRFRAELQCEEGDTQLIEEESTRYLATTKTDSKTSTIRR